MKWFSSWDFDGNEYRIYRPITWTVVLITCCLILFIFYLDNFSGQTHGYSYCPSSAGVTGCFNGFYESNVCGHDRTVFFFFTQKGLDASSPICATQHMNAGDSFGDPEPWIVANVWFIVIGLLIAGIGLNHLLFNVNYRKKNEVVSVGGNITLSPSSSINSSVSSSSSSVSTSSNTSSGIGGKL